MGFGSRVNGFRGFRPAGKREGFGSAAAKGRERGEFGQRRPRERERVSGGGGWLVAGGSQGEGGAAKKSKRERERREGGGAASTGREREVIFGLVIIRVSYFFLIFGFGLMAEFCLYIYLQRLNFLELLVRNLNKIKTSKL